MFSDCSLQQGCQICELLELHCIYEQLCQRSHEVLCLENTTFLGKDLCNVAQSKVDLKKKCHHLSSISEVISA